MKRTGILLGSLLGGVALLGCGATPAEPNEPSSPSRPARAEPPATEQATELRPEPAATWDVGGVEPLATVRAFRGSGPVRQDAVVGLPDGTWALGADRLIPLGSGRWGAARDAL